MWIDGSILLIAGRIDHDKGEEISLCRDLAVDWDDAIAKGPDVLLKWRPAIAADAGGCRLTRGSGANGNGARASGGAAKAA